MNRQNGILLAAVIISLVAGFYAKPLYFYTKLQFFEEYRRVRHSSDVDNLRPTMDSIEVLLKDHALWYEGYDRTHLKRYAGTINLMRSHLEKETLRNAVVLGVGEKGSIPLILNKLVGVSRIDANSIGEDAQTFVVRSTSTGDSLLIDIKDVNAELETWPYPDNSYDIIVCFETLEHFERDPAFFALEAHRVLKPGGKLVLTSPNSSSIRALAAIVQGKDPLLYSLYGLGPITHPHEYSYEQLMTLITGSGFKIDFYQAFSAYDGFGNEAFEVKFAELISTANLTYGMGPSQWGNTHFMIASKAGTPEWRKRYPVYAPEVEERFSGYETKTRPGN
jgi:SAM-dependent methyltransferase